MLRLSIGEWPNVRASILDAARRKIQGLAEFAASLRSLDLSSSSSQASQAVGIRQFLVGIMLDPLVEGWRHGISALLMFIYVHLCSMFIYCPWSMISPGFFHAFSHERRWPSPQMLRLLGLNILFSRIPLPCGHPGTIYEWWRIWAPCPNSVNWSSGSWMAGLRPGKMYRWLVGRFAVTFHYEMACDLQ